MARYEYMYTSFLCVFLLYCCYCPIMVMSQLSQNQTSTMANLSKLLGTSAPWNSGNHSNPCSWNGVTCDSTKSHVIMISLSGNSLSSSDFLPVLCQLETLQHLDVSNNSLASIPDEFITECGKMKYLKLLNFSRNLLSGSLPTFLGFDALEYLDMSFNVLGSSIDIQLDEMIRLKSLNLTHNNFNGTLPTKLGKSMVLEQLVLSNNQFQGEIPEELFSYENLTSIDLGGNTLSGAIPTHIVQLSKLQTLILSSNHLSGPIPISILNITTLVRFAANLNRFSGSLPSDISNNLISLDLSGNNLSGPIPKNILSSPKMEVVDLSNNTLSGTLLLTSISPSMIRLRLGNNLLKGDIPSDAFAKAQNLTYLELESNALTGAIPAILGSCLNLALLDLSQNHLSGTLPPELGNLRNLQVLKLQMNKFNGTITTPFQIGQLQKLLTLNLSQNSLTGSIPSQISSLSNLKFLNLQMNNLSGSIPPSIGISKSLLDLQLGGNQLSGAIPSMPISLQVAVNLSHNNFSGSIPSSLSSLDNLEILDLSYNKFSGGVPGDLAGMSSLTELLLTNNNQLSGVLPKFTHFVQVEYNGTSLVLAPTSDNPTPSYYPGSRKKGSSVVVAILVAIAAAVFLVGLVTLLLVLVSRHYSKVNDENIHSGEDHRLPQVVQSHLLTLNGLHRSNIDFSKAMEAVAETSNVTLKTRFSTYYKAIMPSGSIYFVKKMNSTERALPASSHVRIGKEMEALAKLNNSNVMTPLAYVLSSDAAYTLYEFVSNGSLFDVLHHGSMGNSLDWASRYSISVGVAQGLSFLHGITSSPLLLLDLSSKSIMLKSLKEPLVGDIEHYKVIDPSKSTGNFSALAGSVGYVPPEYAYTMTVTVAGNVYSFGVILLELLTGKPAVTEGTELVKWVLHNSMNKDYILDSNVSKTSQAVRNQMLAILQIALVCVSTSPETRPKMKSVLRMLLNAR
ncbi:LRR receptor-like serine/threonine-protein kinase GSO1 [Arachis duranensis]|uniref:LRR receptor-like serine/threonine-protein kinase GSO1 n=1 Tax=Arachis duranensis TaxID=130453 RepID=A0A6P4DLK9_ARADU|nr:LRR receptor-like serine/threonine-protein kinase GSO1 [Arachis duranensis]